MSVEKREGFIVFSDLKGFSKLSPDEQERYLRVHIYLLSKSIKPLLDKALVSNTWGDAIIAVFESGVEAVNFMLSYREEAISSMPVVAKKNVLPRIAGHYGSINLFEDPLLNRKNTISDEINTAARIEPVTRAGEIFVTEQFKESYLKQEGEEQEIVKFERLGMIPLAKGHGERVLHRLINWDERAHIIDKLFEMDLPSPLPKTINLNESEERMLNALEHVTEQEQILSILRTESDCEHTGLFAFEIAKICKKAGLYEEGIRWIEKSQEKYIVVNGITLYPFKTKKDVIKLKADLLTRLERYSESAEILYSLWRNIENNDAKDSSEIMSMLAAQFKRQAIIKDNQVLSRADIDEEMLRNAASLYLEAFRYNIDDYYPAINAAYLLVILGGNEAQRGKQLARYIKSTWGKQRGSSHWLDFTLAETELLQGFYDEALEDMKVALRIHKGQVGIFDLDATKFQIFQFFKLTHKQVEGKNLISLFENHIKDVMTRK